MLASWILTSLWSAGTRVGTRYSRVRVGRRQVLGWYEVGFRLSEAYQYHFEIYLRLMILQLC